MAVQFEKLKQVDQRTRDLVTGFIKSIEIQLNDDPIIPSLVVTICILFYHLGEIFTVCGDHMEVRDTGRGLSIFEQRPTRETAYGNVIINDKYKCIYRWDIKILKFAFTEYDTFIGIDSSNKEYINSGFYERYWDTFYAFGLSAVKTSSNDVRVYEKFGKRIKEGDVVRMEINTNDKTMRVCVNGEDMGIAHKDILFENKEYHLAVSLCSNYRLCENFIKLLNFEIVKM